jgi:activator of 2-hydroxyglutaryl-CoA dehydratase
MNRKCAAGTGAFLEEMAYRLEIPLGDFDSLARGTKSPAAIGSFCTVFAATEMIARIRSGESRESIVRGIFVSLVKRVRELDPLDGNVVLTGGVAAHNLIIAELLSAEIGREVRVPPDAQFTGALGAALFAGCSARTEPQR